MIELELTRTEEDHRRYLLDAVGTLRLEGLFSRNATAETGNEYCNPALTFGRVRGASPRPRNVATRGLLWPAAKVTERGKVFLFAASSPSNAVAKFVR